jgi:DNA-directed RNA polymerase specialized sigma24 family protein
MVKHPAKYAWSSCRAMVGEAPAPSWLATDGLLARFGKRRADARRKYARFVVEGIKAASIWAELRQQIYLGDEKFVKRMQRKAALLGDKLSIPRAQRRPPAQSIAAIAAKHPERNKAIVAAYSTGVYSYREIAEHFGLHLATVGRIIRNKMLQGEN